MTQPRSLKAEAARRRKVKDQYFAQAYGDLAALDALEGFAKLKYVVECLADLKRKVLEKLLSLFNDDLIDVFDGAWPLQARDDQLEPTTDWLIWLLLGGRGSGKTRAGAEWVRERVRRGARRVALVAPTYNEAREVMIEGESGLLNIGDPAERPEYFSSRRRLQWPSGAVGHVFSSEDPDGLRGPQFDTAWADEFCAWERPEDTLSNLRLGLRLPNPYVTPQLTITTTPKPTRALRALLKASGLIVSRARTRDNAANLAPAFAAAMQEAYGGTRLGRQELDGEVMSDHPGALWTRAMIERACESAPPKDLTAYEDIVIAIDPPASSGEAANACGIVVAGRLRGVNDLPARAVILHDGTVQGRSPEQWARAASFLYDRYEASHVVAEANQGGDMVRSVLRQAGAHMALRLVHASTSKQARAAPVALLYEQNRVQHLDRFKDLEDELCELGADNAASRDSPDRADALVWAVTDLLLKKRDGPRIRWL